MAYQAAVNANDAEGMGCILHDNVILVVGCGSVFTRNNLLEAARQKPSIYTAYISALPGRG